MHEERGRRAAGNEDIVGKYLMEDKEIVRQHKVCESHNKTNRGMSGRVKYISIKAYGTESFFRLSATRAGFRSGLSCSRAHLFATRPTSTGSIQARNAR